MRSKFLLAVPVLTLCFNAFAAVPDGITKQLKPLQLIQVNEAGGELNIYMKKPVVHKEVATSVIQNLCSAQFDLAPGQEAFADDPKLVDKWPADKYKSINVVNDLGVGFALSGGFKDCKTLGNEPREKYDSYFNENIKKTRIDKLPR